MNGKEKAGYMHIGRTVVVNKYSHPYNLCPTCYHTYDTSIQFPENNAVGRCHYKSNLVLFVPNLRGVFLFVLGTLMMKMLNEMVGDRQPAAAAVIPFCSEEVVLSCR